MLENGSNLATLIGSDSATVLVVLDPVHGFTCASQLAEWLAWREENPGRLRIVLSRPPRGAEQKLLRTVRIPVDGVLRSPPTTPLPAELVFRGGALVHADSGLDGRHSPLLLHLRTGSVEEFPSSRAPEPGYASVHSPSLTPENHP